MALPGSDFYDDEVVAAAYARTRTAWADNPNDTLEQPIMRSMIGPLSGLRILDLGCGTAGFGAFAEAQGAESYVGIDGSSTMASLATTTLAQWPFGSAMLADLETWTPPDRSFDLVTSSLALHYVANLDVVIQNAFDALVPGGRMVFSVEHPIMTASDCGHQSGPNPDCLVDDYFFDGAREVTWLGARVVKYHHPIEDYISVMQRAGFAFEQLRESTPVREHFADEVEFERRMRTPLFLFLSGRKPT